MKFRIVIKETRAYEADADALKAEFPAEYEAFLAEGESSDRAWVEDCWEIGGTELFRLVNVTGDVDISVVS